MRLYLDSSVFGGYYDEEFKLWTMPLIESIRSGINFAVISDLTIREIEPAPKNVKSLLNEIIELDAELVTGSKESEELANRYIAEGALTLKSTEDANHIALATLHTVSALISWNFKHIVNLNRIRLFNSVNLKYGYNPIEIRSPMEIATS